MSLFHYFRARPTQHAFCIMHCVPLPPECDDGENNK